MCVRGRHGIRDPAAGRFSQNSRNVSMVSEPTDQRVFQLDGLTTEAQNPASREIDRLTPLEIVYLMNDEDRRVPDAVLSQAVPIARAIDAVAAAFRAGGRLIYVGAGTSGRLGVLDAAECPPTFGTPPEMVVGVIAGGHRALVRAVEGAEDRGELAVADLEPLNLSASDVVCGIATSGRTPYVLAALRYARQRGCTTIALACNQDAVVLEQADIPIVPVVGPEVLSGSTRLKAGTATKLVLNMITTGAMVRIGKTYGNLMVDLKATNTKLHLRACRIVSELLGIGRDQARELLDRCDWEVKTALVAGKRGCAPEEARRLLDAARGHVRVALGEEEPAGELVLQPGERLVVGVDGGGTRTRAVVAAVATDGTYRVLARAEQPGANANVCGFDQAAKHVTRAVLQALRQARHGEAVVDGLVACLAGAGDAAVRDRWLDWLWSLGLAREIAVHTDIDAVYAAAGTERGVCVIAGTGALVQVRDGEGTCARAGGWGWLVGDPGSGFWLGRIALQRLCQHVDTSQPLDELDRRLLASLQPADQPYESIRAFLYGQPQLTAVRRMAELAITVAEAAEAGIVPASELLDQAAAALAAHVREALAAARADVRRPWPVLLGGGLQTRSSLLRDRLLERLATLLRIEDVRSVDDPVLGAVQLAARLVCSGADA